MRKTILVKVIIMIAVFHVQVVVAGAGQKLYEELKEKNQLYQDDQWQSYVNEVGQRLLAVSPHAGRDYHFYVIDDSGVNAMALPDGYIFVNRGLISYLRSEDELAGVLGHEIGHVVGSHARRTNAVGFFGNVVGLIGAFMTGTGAIADLGNTVTQTIRSGYGREFELEADEYGSKFLARAGYNPLAMIDVIHVLKDHSLFSRNVLNQPAVYHGLFSTHPKNDKRLHEVVHKSQLVLPDKTQEPIRDFWGMVDGLVYGNEAANGLIKGSVYYHSSLRVVVEFPEDWDVTNSPTEVIGEPFENNPKMKIILQRMSLDSENQTPQDFLTETLKRDDILRGQAIEINDYDCFSAELDPGDSSIVRRVMAAIVKDGKVYLFEGHLDTGGNIDEFDSFWLATINSFRAMTATDLLEANAQRIKVVVAKPDDTYRELAKRASVKSYAEEILRVINGHHPLGEPRAGDRIKIVQ